MVANLTVGKPLRDELEGLRSYRMGRLRIIYRLSARARVVELLAIRPGPESRKIRCATSSAIRRIVVSVGVWKQPRQRLALEDAPDGRPIEPPEEGGIIASRRVGGLH